MKIVISLFHNISIAASWVFAVAREIENELSRKPEPTVKIVTMTRVQFEEFMDGVAPPVGKKPEDLN